MTYPIWRPAPERVAESNMQRFLQAQAHRLETLDYRALYRWSVDRSAEFWEAFWRFSDIRATIPYRSVLTEPERMPGARWFEGARLNFADNLLRPEYQGTALVFYSERGERIDMSWAELRRQVGSVAQALQAMGVGPEDRVVGLLPNRPEAVVAMLATASVGAVWSSCSPDFGANAVLDRLGQIGAKVLFATDGYFYNGKTIDCLPMVARVADSLSSLEAVFVVGYVEPEPDLRPVPGARRYSELLRGERGAGFRPLPFSHPLYIMFSSGTTGIPKCIVHGAGGTLVQHLKEHRLHCDIKAGDPVFYFTTIGWMMWIG